MAGLLAGLAGPGPLGAQPPEFRPAPVYPGGSRPDQATGAQALAEFRRAGLAGDSWLAFELRVMPRQGAERRLGGRLFGGRRGDGTWTRLHVPFAGGEARWLIRSGANPAAWALETGEAAPTVRPLGPAEAFTPLAGTDVTLFDLQMPFLHWDDFVYEGLARVRGRPAHRLLLYPPADLRAARPELSAVRVFLDTQFQALVQAEQLGAKGEVMRTLTVLDLKRTADQWIVKSIDVRDHRTRDKTRFTVTAAALGQSWPAATFAPAQLDEDPPVVATAAIERF